MRRTQVSAATYYLGTTPSEEKVLSALSQSGSLTADEIVQQTGIKSRTSLSKSLTEMKDAGYIFRDYNSRYAKWSINPDHYASVLVSPPTEG